MFGALVIDRICGDALLLVVRWLYKRPEAKSLGAVGVGGGG
jgi:hypothetical protein